jgi:hypothetical protein
MSLPEFFHRDRTPAELGSSCVKFVADATVFSAAVLARHVIFTLKGVASLSLFTRV